MTTVELEDADAGAFLIWMKHRELWDAMLNAGLHEIQGGSATLHFDPAGRLLTVETKRITLKNGRVLKS